MLKNLLLIIAISTVAFAKCKPCDCKEYTSTAMTQQYKMEVEKNISDKINPKIEKIKDKAKRIKELQTKINEKLNEYRNLEVHNFVLNKQKIHYLTSLKEQFSSGIDITSVETKAITQRIQEKIKTLALYQGNNIDKTVQDYINKK